MGSLFQREKMREYCKERAPLASADQ